MLGFFFFCVYLAASFQEWMFHKYLMHQPSDPLFDRLYRNHMLHHANTKEDYTMENGSTEYICFDVLSVDGIVQMGIVFSLNTGIFYILFPTVSLPIIATTVLSMLGINVLVWNTIHSYVHGFDPSVICSPPGLPRIYGSENGMMGWLVENHRRHHDQKGTNYNIVFPGADHIMGTYYYREHDIIATK